jgi:hypothetical protein
MKSTWFSLVVPRVLHVRDRRFVSQVRQDVTTRYVVGNRVVSRLFWVVSGKRATTILAAVCSPPRFSSVILFGSENVRDDDVVEKARDRVLRVGKDRGSHDSHDITVCASIDVVSRVSGHYGGIVCASLLCRGFREKLSIYFKFIPSLTHLTLHRTRVATDATERNVACPSLNALFPRPGCAASSGKNPSTLC